MQAIVESRKNSFSAPDEVLLERKGSADSQGVFLLDRSSSTVEGHSHGPWSYTDRSPDNGQHPSRYVFMRSSPVQHACTVCGCCNVYLVWRVINLDLWSAAVLQVSI